MNGKAPIPPLEKIEVCPYCVDYKGDPKPIFLEDMKLAKKMLDGTYMCRMCLIDRMLKLNGIRKNE
jgi:hypothetical protein